MRKTNLMSICLLAVFWALPAVADDCSDLEAQEAKVAAAKNCGEAHKLFEACLWGSTADIQRSAMVTQTCEKAFSIEPETRPAEKLQPEKRRLRKKISQPVRHDVSLVGSGLRGRDGA
ncbi:hypothetical protein [Methylocystis sp. Sn-Cys]|uniref:hypothetical protein n=1 Tax=Methylocystis sp. Sn-Cys TaxID=1701263 RepID=UPI001923A3BB|nr:hypothetical protein [Methylocystis sp. Sn-Cys]MBL1258530.1 hypothetical protein [Methylocystis sp. Sn-Cys]